MIVNPLPGALQLPGLSHRCFYVIDTPPHCSIGVSYLPKFIRTRFELTNGKESSRFSIGVFNSCIV